MAYYAYPKETAFKYPISRNLEFCFKLGCSFFLESLSLFEQTMITYLKRNGIFKPALHTNSGIFETAFFFIHESALVRPHETGPFSRVVLRPSTHKSRYNSMQFPYSYGRGISFILSLIPEGNLQ